MIIGLPRLAGHHTRTTSAHVFRHTLLGHGMNIQSGQIYSYMHRRTILQSARFGFHEAPRAFWAGIWADVEVGSTTANHTPLPPNKVNKVSYSRDSSLLAVRERDTSIPRPDIFAVAGPRATHVTYYFSWSYT